MEENREERFLDLLEEDQNSAPVQYELGLCYLRGDGVEQNGAEAQKWLRRAAEQGHQQARELLSSCIKEAHQDSGETGAVTEELLPEWCMRAENGEAEAQYQVALYFMRDGTSAGQADVKRYLEMAAEQGHPLACLELGIQLLKSAPERGVRLLQNAVDCGVGQAAYQLGCCYSKGIGVKKDAQQAERYFIQAAEWGGSQEKLDLAVWYAMGERSLTASWGKALSWVKQARDAGMPDAKERFDAAVEKRRAEREARKKAEEEARKKAQERARKQAEEKARRQAEEAVRRQAEEEARKKAEEAARQRAAAEAKRREELARHRAEARAKQEALREEQRRQRAIQEEARQRAAQQAAQQAAFHPQNHQADSAAGSQQTQQLSGIGKVAAVFVLWYVWRWVVMAVYLLTGTLLHGVIGRLCAQGIALGAGAVLLTRLGRWIGTKRLPLAAELASVSGSQLLYGCFGALWLWIQTYIQQWSPLGFLLSIGAWVLGEFLTLFVEALLGKSRK